MTQEWYSDKDAKPQFLVIEIPHLEEMLDHAEDNRIDHQCLLVWIGVTLDKMSLLSYADYHNRKQLHGIVDNIMRDFESHLWLNTRDAFVRNNISRIKCADITYVDSSTLLVKFFSEEEIARGDFDVRREHKRPSRRKLSTRAHRSF